MVLVGNPHLEKMIKNIFFGYVILPIVFKNILKR